jgi:hypothetical protein
VEGEKAGLVFFFFGETFSSFFVWSISPREGGKQEIIHDREPVFLFKLKIRQGF